MGGFSILVFKNDKYFSLKIPVFIIRKYISIAIVILGEMYILNTFLSGDTVIFLAILHSQIKLKQLQVDGHASSLQPFFSFSFPFLMNGAILKGIEGVTLDEVEQT